jgi:hypothetical protein
VKSTSAQKLARRKRRIARRLDHRRKWRARAQPMFTARNVRYEISDRDGGLTHGMMPPATVNVAVSLFESNVLDHTDGAAPGSSLISCRRAKAAVIEVKAFEALVAMIDFPSA